MWIHGLLSKLTGHQEPSHVAWLAASAPFVVRGADRSLPRRQTIYGSCVFSFMISTQNPFDTILDEKKGYFPSRIGGKRVQSRGKNIYITI